MISILKAVYSGVIRFISSPLKVSLLLIGVLAFAALVDFMLLGANRRTFVFKTIDDGAVVVEERMLRHARTVQGERSREREISHYVAEALLGPASPDLLPLFPRGTQIISFLYRNRIVYADFSQLAALPPMEGGNVIGNFRTLHSGILRNFPYIKDVRFFIEGNAVLLWLEYSSDTENTEEGVIHSSVKDIYEISLKNRIFDDLSLTNYQKFIRMDNNSNS